MDSVSQCTPPILGNESHSDVPTILTLSHRVTMGCDPVRCTGPHEEALLATTGGQLQPVLMRPTPQLSFKTWGGGGSWGGVQPGVGGGSGRGSGGGSGRGSGGGSGRGSGGVQPGVRGGGVRVRVQVRVRVSPRVRVRVRVRVTELVEPVLVL